MMNEIAKQCPPANYDWNRPAGSKGYDWTIVFALPENLSYSPAAD